MLSDKIISLKTIIVSRPGVMREALRAALAAYPWLAIIASAGDGLTALNSVTTHRPELLVIDSNLLAEEVEALLAAVKTQSPATRCLIYVQSSQQAAQLRAAGAAAVILRDSPAQELQAALIRLVQTGFPSLPG